MASSTIVDNRYICDPFIKDEVVIMEDSKPMRDVIQEVIEGIGWQTKFVNNRTEAVQLVKNKEAAYFILDNWIDKNKQEGFDTLEVIRELDRQVFVTILTGHPDPKNKKLAERLKANLYKEKSPVDYRQDIKEIALEILKYKKEIVNKVIDNQVAKLEGDPNIIAYETAKQDPQWLEKYQGRYVAFVNGKLVDSDTNESEILKRIREKYPDKPRFFRQVEEIEENPIDLPSSLWFDDIDISL
jgi:CheY-like chemotaxis protein